MDANEEKKKKIKVIMGKVNTSKISSIKQTVTQIVKVISDPNSSAKDLKNVIEIDPPMSARLLKLANSAFYGLRKKISGIQEAIICIGFDAVKELALTQKFCELFDGYDNLHGYSRISLWKHSIAVALCSKLIYRREFYERGENIYAAGLLHDIGLIILDQFQQSELLNILKKSIIDKENLVNIENDVLGFNHMDIGEAIAEDWGFSNEMAVAIGNHHNPDSVKGEFAKITSIVYISDYISQSKKIGYSDAPYENYALFHKCLMKHKIKNKAIEIIMEEVEEEINKMEEAGWFKHDE